MEIGRTFGLEFVEKLLNRKLLLRRALQLEEHVVDLKIVSHGAAIVGEPCFGMSVACEGDAIHLINALGDARTSTQARFNLCREGLRGNKYGEDGDGEEPEFAKHGFLS